MSGAAFFFGAEDRGELSEDPPRELLERDGFCEIDGAPSGRRAVSRCGVASEVASSPATSWRTGTGLRWAIQITPNDQRTMNLDELVMAWLSGLINGGLRCRRTGSAQWEPVREVPELRVALSSNYHSSLLTECDELATGELTPRFSQVAAASVDPHTAPTVPVPSATGKKGER